MQSRSNGQSLSPGPLFSGSMCFRLPFRRSASERGTSCLWRISFWSSCRKSSIAGRACSARKPAICWWPTPGRGMCGSCRTRLNAWCLYPKRKKRSDRSFSSDYIRQRHRPSPSLRRRSEVSRSCLLEEEMIRETLVRLGQNKSRTARALGISRQSLLEKLRRMGVEA